QRRRRPADPVVRHRGLVGLVDQVRRAPVRARPVGHHLLHPHPAAELEQESVDRAGAAVQLRGYRHCPLPRVGQQLPHRRGERGHGRRVGPVRPRRHRLRRVAGDGDYERRRGDLGQLTPRPFFWNQRDMIVFRCAAVAAIAVGLLGGCSKQPVGEAAASLTLLQEVNDMLHHATGAAGRPPAKAAELDRYRADYPPGDEAVKSGGVVLLWGTPLKGEGEVGMDELLLAYEKNTPIEGGFVLLSAGTGKKGAASGLSAPPEAGEDKPTRVCLPP